MEWETIKVLLPAMCFALFFGGLGGLTNALLLNKDLLIPKISRDSEGRLAVSVGSLGNVLIGAMAGFLTWLLGANDLPAIKQIGLCILAGIGGGNIILSMLQNKQLTLQESKLKEATDLLGQSIQKLASRKRNEAQSVEEVEDEQ